MNPRRIIGVREVSMQRFVCFYWVDVRKSEDGFEIVRKEHRAFECEAASFAAARRQCQGRARAVPFHVERVPEV